MRSFLVVLGAVSNPALSLASDSPAAAARGDGLLWLLCGALALAIAGILYLLRERRSLLSAQIRLGVLANQIKKGEPPHWRDTGAFEIDAIGQSLLNFDQRLRAKREKLRELNELMLKSAERQMPPGQLRNSILRTMIDAMPVGVLVAEAPSGRILEGNRSIEKILRHPVIYSDSNNEYWQWNGFHADGRPVSSAEYPLARALAGEEHPALECKYQRGDGSVIWISIIGAPIRNETGEIIGAIIAVTDIDDIKNVESQRRTMNLELHHRVNNALAMIQGIANITARTATNLASFRENFSDRIQCLSRISTLLVQNSWDRTPLKDVIETAVSCEGERRNVLIEGEPVSLRSEVALALGMALHELLSNAEQFGALSHPDGVVRIDWRQEDGEHGKLVLRWTETGGPSATTPARTGVGLYLLNNVLARQLGGMVQLAFEPSGLRAVISAAI